MKAKDYLLRFCLFAVLSLSFLPVTAQELPGIADSIYSEILGEHRAIQVVLPDNYTPGSEQTYDAVYLLDGEWNTYHFEYLRNTLVQEGFVPDFIIVGLPNTYIDNINQRDRDFLGITEAQNSQSGEAEKFTRFLSDELLPYINSKYPVNDQKFLYGHSYGGLFTVSTFLHHPEIFDAYIATDPSLWWGNRQEVSFAHNNLNDSKYLNKTLWIAGITNTKEGMGITALDSVFNKTGDTGVYWKIEDYPNETHNSVRLKGIYDGLKFLYSGYNAQLAFHPMNGILLDGYSTPLFLDTNFEEVRFTTDGSTPTLSSEILKEGIQISAPASIVATSFSGRQKYTPIVKGEFLPGKALPAVSKPEGYTPGGLNYSVFEGDWRTIPDFDSLIPVQRSRIDENFNFNQFPLTNFGLLIEGYFEAKEPGHYIFAMDSDDGSRFTLGGNTLLELDGLHGTGNMQSYIIPLEKGFYKVRLEYFQADEGRELDVLYVPPGSMQAMPIPLEFQYGKKL